MTRIILDEFPFRDRKILNKLTKTLRKPIRYSFPEEFNVTDCINVLEFANVSTLKGLYVSNKWQLILACAKTQILIFDLHSKELKLIFEPDRGDQPYYIDNFNHVVIEEVSQKGMEGDALILSHAGVHNGFIIKFDLRSILEKRQEIIIWKRTLTHVPCGMVLRYNIFYENEYHNFIYSVDFSEIVILNSKDSNIIAKIRKGAELSPFSLCFAEEECFIFVCEFVIVTMLKEEGLKRWTKVAEFKNPSMLLPSNIIVDPITKQFLALSDSYMHVFNWETKALIHQYNLSIKNPLGAFWSDRTGELFVSDAFSKRIFILK